MHAVFLGDSHAHAVIRSLSKAPQIDWVRAVDIRRVESIQVKTKEVPRDLARQFLHRVTTIGKKRFEARQPISKEVPPDLTRQFPADIVFCCFGGTEYNLLSLVEADEPTDFMFDRDDTVMPGRKIIPNGVVRAALALRLRSAHSRLQAVRAAYKCPLVCVAPPPPFLELGDPAGLPSAFTPLLARGITPAPIRRKWYRTQIDLLAAQCAADGIGLMAAPTSAQDAEGFLLRSFWTNDPTHGNAAYGSALIEQMKASEFV